MFKLKELREEKKLTQQELANIFNVAKNTISQWENQKNEINYEMLIKITDYFNISIDYLLGREPPNKISFTNVLTEKENIILNEFNELSEDLQDYAISIIKDIKKEFNNIKKKTKDIINSGEICKN